MVGNHSIRVSEETDFKLDNLKLKSRLKGRRVYKRDIIAFAVDHCMSMPDCEKYFHNWLDKRKK